MIEFEDNSPEVLQKILQTTDMLLGLEAANIEKEIKTSGNTPIKQGNLRSSARSMRISENHYEVVDTAEYAAAQEAGQMTVKEQRVVTPDKGATFFTLKPGVYKFVNHPRGGGPHFFEKAITATLEREEEFASMAIDAVGWESI